MAGFKPSRPDQDSENQHYVLLDDSLTVTIGDVIAGLTGTFGKATNATIFGSNKAILGVVTGFTNAFQQVIGNGDSTVLATGSSQGYYAQYLPAHAFNQFYAPLDAVSGTTTGSDQPLVYFDLVDASHLQESSVAHWGTIKQFFSLGVNPTNSSQVLGQFVQNPWTQFDAIAG